MACALLKELHFLEDTTGISTNLHYVRTKDGREIDFLVQQENEPTHLIKVKTTDDEPASAFKHFAPSLPHTKYIQLVKTLSREKTFPHGLAIKSLIPWLKNLDLTTAE